MIYPLKMVIFHSFFCMFTRGYLDYVTWGEKDGKGELETRPLSANWTFGTVGHFSHDMVRRRHFLGREWYVANMDCHHPLRFTGLAHGWFVSATSSCAFLLEDSNLFVSIHFDQVRLHRWRDTCPVSGVGCRTLAPRVSSRVSTWRLLHNEITWSSYPKRWDDRSSWLHRFHNWLAVIRAKSHSHHLNTSPQTIWGLWGFR